MPQQKENNESVYKVYAETEELLYKKAEEIVESLTPEERDQLESVGWELDLEEVFRLILEYLQEHFETREFSLEHVKEDLKKIDKKLLFEL